MEQPRQRNRFAPEPARPESTVAPRPEAHATLHAGLEWRLAAGGKELWVRPLGLGLGPWSRKPAVGLVLGIVLLAAVGTLSRPLGELLPAAVAVPVHWLMLWAAFDLLGRVRAQRLVVRDEGRLSWTRYGREMTLDIRDVASIELAPARGRPWRVALQAVRSDGGRVDLVRGMWPGPAERTAQALRETLAALPEAPPPRPGQGVLGLGPPPEPDDLPETGDPELEAMAAALPVPPGLVVDQPVGAVELLVRRRAVFGAAWRGTAIPRLVAWVLGMGIGVLLLRHLPAALLPPWLDVANVRAAGTLVAVVFWVQLIRLLLMVLPSTRVRIGRHGVQVDHRSLRSEQSLVPVADIAQVQAQRLGSGWAVLLQLRDGQARIVASRLPSEALAHAAALWVRVGVSRARSGGG